MKISVHNKQPEAVEVDNLMEDLLTGDVNCHTFCDQVANLTPEDRAQLVAEIFRLHAQMNGRQAIA